MHLADFLQITLQLLGQLHQGWEPSWTNTHIFQNLPKALEISEVLTFHFRPRALSASRVSVQPRWSCRGLNTVRLEARGGLSLPTGLSCSGGKSLCARVVYILKVPVKQWTFVFTFITLKFLFSLCLIICVRGEWYEQRPEESWGWNYKQLYNDWCEYPVFSFTTLCWDHTPALISSNYTSLIVVCVDTKSVCLSSGQKCQARQCPWTLYSWHICQHLFTLFLPLSWTTFQNSHTIFLIMRGISL